jgi:LytS/YehU family sensor histidine kinase
MDDRLETSVDIPVGLHSAECPPMVLQMLVENAIKHGLEPKPEGGLLQVQAAVVDGDLRLTVTDSGVGLGTGWQDSSGTGLKNIRERLALRYGAAAQLVVEPREGGGARVVVRLPYRVVSPGAGTPGPQGDSNPQSA